MINEDKENADLLHYYNFKAAQYYALYKNKHESSIKSENFNSLFNNFYCDIDFINHNVYGEMALCDMVFAYPKKQAFESLLDLDYDIENEDEIFDISVAKVIRTAEDIGFNSVSIYLYKCLLLYSKYDDIYVDSDTKELCIEYLNKHYARFFGRFCDELDKARMAIVLKNIYDTLKNYRSYYHLSKVSDISRGIYEKFVLYIAIYKSKTPESAMETLKGIFTENFYGEIYSGFYPAKDRFGVKNRAVFNIH